jgi:hypothetical protein
MKLALLAGAVALSLTLPALAQDTPTPETTPAANTVTVMVGSERVPITLPADEAMAAYAWQTHVSPSGQFVTMVAFANVADVGMVQLTPCDNVTVACEAFTVRAEGVNQGDVFGLGFIEDAS